MKTLVLRLALALITFTLGVWAEMVWVAYCLPDLAPRASAVCYQPRRTYVCGLGR